MDGASGKRPGAARWITVAAVAVTLTTAACSSGETSRDSGETVPRPVLATPTAAMPARYVTDLAFSGFGSAAPVAVLRFRNDVSSAALTRRYRIWVAHGSRWASVLSSSDSLPVPRAAWRILPGDGLRVLAASGGELDGLVFRSGPAAFQLEPGKVLDEWTSPTGQRSRLLLAAWAEGEEPATGLLFERREARPYDSPPTRTLEEALLATDPAGNGLLLLRDTGDQDPGREATTAYTWIQGSEARWPESRVQVQASSGASGWSVRIPDLGLDASLTYGPLAVDDSVVSDSTSADAGVRIHALRGTLRLAGHARTVHGIAFLVRGP
jgi:hypothetical protein